MRYLLVGGDGRSLHLAERLAEEGNEVFYLGAEKAELSEKVTKTEDTVPCDCVLLPLPAKKGEAANAPFAQKSISYEEIFEKLPQGSCILGGKLGAELMRTAAQRGHRLFDYLSLPEFNMGNAAISAEAAVMELMSGLHKALFECRILIIGYGRIGKILAEKLRGLGARVSVSTRSREARALSLAFGMEPQAELCDYDAVVNTAPAVFSGDVSHLRRDCLVLELATGAVGFDAGELECLGIRYKNAQGLPGIYAPESAAALLREAVANILKEAQIK